MDPSLEPATLEYPPKKTSLPPIPNELLEDIFLRLSTPADLIRVAVGCISFRNIIVERSFLRRFRKIHGMPLLGFLDCNLVFHPTIRPHPSTPAASVIAVVADFSFSFLPGPTHNWIVADIRDGRVLLDRIYEDDTMSIQHGVFRERVVCDPLYRRYVLLPPIPDEIVSSVEDSLWIKQMGWYQTLLLPPSDNDEESMIVEGTSFRVILMVHCETMMVCFVFSSWSRQWCAISTLGLSTLLSNLLPPTWIYMSTQCQYMSGSFYWVSNWWDIMLVLDTNRMVFYIANPPSKVRDCSKVDTTIIEAEEDKPGMFVYRGATELEFRTIRKNNGESFSQWKLEKIIPLGFRYHFVGSTERHLFLCHGGSSSVDASCFSLDFKTYQVDRVCASKTSIPLPHAYCNFPPSLLSSPTVASVDEKEMLEQDAKMLQTQDPIDSHHDNRIVDGADSGGQASVSMIEDGAN